jgi:hypothetical protein
MSMSLFLLSSGRRAATRHARRVMAACADLQRLGVRIRTAHVAPEPRVWIEPPAPEQLPTYGWVPPPRGCIAAPTACFAIHRGVRVEWFATKEAAR